MLESEHDHLLAALRAGGRVAQSFHGKKPRHWTKPDGTTVTEADVAVDDMLKSLTATAFPDDGWLSEETADTQERLTKKRLWIFDPIDGTREFLGGGDNWCIGGALCVEGEVMLSAVFLPAKQIMLSAKKGAGAFRDGVRFNRSSSYSAEVIAPRSKFAVLGEAGFQPKSGDGLPLLLRLVAVAEGRLAGAVSLGEKNDWDIAGAHLLLTEVGGVLTDLMGGSLVYNRPKPWQRGLVAAHADWHDVILDCVRG